LTTMLWISIRSIFLTGIAEFYGQLQPGQLDAAEDSAHKLERLDAMHRFPQVHLILAGVSSGSRIRRERSSSCELI